MKSVITCICLLFASVMMAQNAPTSSSEARKVNMSRTNARSATPQVSVKPTDGLVENTSKGDFGITVAPVEGGVEIKDFAYQNSTARAAKLQKGDVITGINSKTVSNQEELTTVLASYDLGDVVTVHYNRDTRTLTKDVRIGRK